MDTRCIVVRVEVEMCLLKPPKHRKIEQITKKTRNISKPSKPQSLKQKPCHSKERTIRYLLSREFTRSVRVYSSAVCSSQVVVEFSAPVVAPKRTHNGQHKEATATPRLSSLPTRGLWAAEQLKHLARTAGTVEPEGGGPQDVAARLATRLGVQVIGVDPGKAELAVASDPARARGRRKIRTVRYTAAQRRAATGPGIYRLKLTSAERARGGDAARSHTKHLANEHRRTFMCKASDVAAMEQSLSSTCASVASGAGFGAYIAARAAVLQPLLAHYAQLHFRRHHWRHRRESERSIARFVSQLRGMQRDPHKPLLVAWGAWGAVAGRPGQACNRGHPPCIGVGLMRRVAKELPVVTTPEYKTSKTCCRCGHACGRHAAVEANRPGDHPRWRAHEIRGLRLCSNSECHRPLNRDANAAVNIGTQASSIFDADPDPVADLEAALAGHPNNS